MKIDLLWVDKNRRVLRSFIEKGRQDSESFLFDFDNGHLYFATSKSAGRLTLDIEREPGDTHTHLFVDAEKLLHLASHYRHVTLDNDNVFWSGEDSFVFPTFSDARIAKRIMSNECLGNPSRTNEIYLDSERLELLQMANGYVDQLHSRTELRGVFLHDGKMVAVNKAIIFEAETGTPSVDQNLAKWLVLVIILLDEGTTIQKCSEKDSYRVDNPNRHVEFVCRNDNSLTAPDTESEKFVSAYSHSTKITFNREEMLSTIRFLEGYTKLEKNDSLKVTIKNKQLELKSNLQGIFKKVFDIDYVDDGLNDTDFLVSATKLKLALNTLSSEHVEVYMDPESPLMKFTGFEEPGIKILLAKIKE